MKKLKSIFIFFVISVLMISVTSCQKSEAYISNGFDDNIFDSEPPLVVGNEDTAEDFEEIVPPSNEIPPENETQPPSSNDDDKENVKTETTTPIVTPVKEYATYVESISSNLNIRASSSTSSSSLGQIQKGERLIYLGQVGSWYKTNYKNQTAYISSNTKYTKLVKQEKSTNELVEKVIESGCKLLGTTYVYGAVRLHDGKGNFYSSFTATKFDCSSLVQYIFYYGANKYLPINTRTQIYQGDYVKPSNLQRGDLIFFTNTSRQYNTGIERVGHVALYLGNEYVLHTASDYAKIEKLTADRWNFYIQANRYL